MATSREIVQKSINHQSIERVPIDFGSTAVTGIHVLAVEGLRKYYGLEYHPVKAIEPYQMLGEIEDDLQAAMGIDIIGISGKNNMFGIANEHYREFKTFWGQTVLLPAEFNTTYDEEGNLLVHPQGDTTVPPSGKMPKTSYFFDAIIRQQEIDEFALDPLDNLEEFAPLMDADLKYWEKEINRVAGKGKAVVANFGGTALGDIALVPGLNLKNPRGIRDIAEWYMSTVMRKDYVHTIFEMQTDIALNNLDKLFAVVGNKVDVVFLCGTDFGTQDSQFCSAEAFDELYKPYYRKVNDWIHKNTSWRTFKHSCGAVEPLVQHFIDAGFDILNPVQINAAGMDPQHLKDTYGSQITFWGGGIDTQKILPFASPKEVENQVLNQCKIFSKNGGFVFNTVHNIQANVPVENIVAMVDALKKFNHG
jgi:hypothetical protein